MKKQLIALGLSLAMVFSGMAPAFAAEEQIPKMSEQVVQMESPVSAEDSSSTEMQETEIAEAEQLKNIKTETEVSINPLYADVQSEADLKNPANGISAQSDSEEEYTSDESVLAENIRIGMENREETITLYYESEQEYDSTLLKKWVNMACEETDVPTQGDYIRWVWGGYKASVSYYQKGGIYYYTYTITVTYYTTAEQETQVTQKVEELLNDFGFTSTTPDYTKIKTIYDYICENVTYDYDNLEDDDYKLKYTAYAALINGTAVCQGYAVLLYRMMEEVGVDTRVISGTGNGGSHGWNITQLRDAYYNVDSTWDAGTSSYSYFLKCDENFGDHTRDEDYSSSEFYAEYPMATEDYVVQDGDLPEDTNITASGTCGENLTWTLDDEGTLTISGTGAMTDYDSHGSDTPWAGYLSSIKTLVVCDGVTSIGAHAFDNNQDALDSIGSLTSVTIPNSVTSIGNHAFAWCNGLTNVTMGNGVTSIGNSAFYWCKQIKSLEIPAGTESIGRDAFGFCESLTSAAIPESVTSIGDAVWEGCTSLTNITVEQGNQNYCSDNGVLYDKARTVLMQYPAGKTDTSFVIPNSVTSIGEGAFYECGSLTSVTIPDSVTSIGEYAFHECDNLQTVTIPSSVESIGRDAFSSCEALAEIWFEGDLPQIGTDAFYEVTATAYYPNTWETVPASDEYGGNLTWVAYEVESTLAITTQPEDYTGKVGETATFTIEANGEGLTYQWQYSNNSGTSWATSSQSGSDTATISVPITKRRNGQQYRCVVTDAAGNQVTSDAATLKIAEVTVELAITSQPEDYTGKVGETATFTIEANGEGLTYQWQYSNNSGTSWAASSQSGSDTATISVPITERRNGQQYRCVVTDAAGNQVTSDAATLKIAEAAVTITSQPEDYTGKVGETATFTIEANGEGLTYQWQYSNNSGASWAASSQSGSDSATISVPITERRNGQQYRCVVTDAAGNQVTSDAATLKIAEVTVELAITSQPEDYTGKVGETATFTIEANGDGLTYQWQYSNNSGTSWSASSQSGSDTATISVPITERRNGQQYRCVVTDAAGNQVTSNAATLIVG